MTLATGIHVDATTERTDGATDPVATMTTERTDGATDLHVDATISAGRTDDSTDLRVDATMATERADDATDLHIDATRATERTDDATDLRVDATRATERTDDATSHPRATANIIVTMTKIIEQSTLGDICPLPTTGAATTQNKRHATNKSNGANR